MDEEVEGLIPEDEFADDDTVVLVTAEGEEVAFVEIAGIAHQGKFYAILQPVELLEGMEEDEAFVFEVTRADNGEDKFSVVVDDEIINAVFEKYNELLDNANSNE